MTLDVQQVQAIGVEDQTWKVVCLVAVVTSVQQVRAVGVEDTKSRVFGRGRRRCTASSSSGEKKTVKFHIFSHEDLRCAASLSGWGGRRA